jgi:hypothetical protein
VVGASMLCELNMRTAELWFAAAVFLMGDRMESARWGERPRDG